MAAIADGTDAVVEAGGVSECGSVADVSGEEVGQPVMDLLRFAAVGSVDDGKSTLIGRLLHDTKQLFDDQIEAVEVASRRRGIDGMDLSFVTDGLRAEREQGITIDVAYRYAATPARKFVIADCPGHVQYTRNMAPVPRQPTLRWWWWMHPKACANRPAGTSASPHCWVSAI